MKTLYHIVLVCAVLLFASCKGSGEGSDSTLEKGVTEKNLYAKLFELTHYSNCSVISVTDPWDTLKTLQKYVLVDKDKPLPDNLPQGTVVRIPVENIIMYTTIHASIWEEFGNLGNVAGICETEYLTSSKALELVKKGLIQDCGKSASPNVEMIMDIGGEIIIASPFENGGYGQAEKLGIPIFESADYMETHPLARVEWMKVFGMLQGRRDLGDSLFRATEENYNRLKAIASNVESKPTVMSERKYGSSWFIPGGDSYIAAMYKDAGADYIFSYNKETGSVPLSFETVYEKGEDADIWIFKYAASSQMTYADLRAEYKPYENFAPFRNGGIYTCNTVDTPYYEYIAIHPDYILADYVKIFHPELLPEYELCYYKPMPR